MILILCLHAILLPNYVTSGEKTWTAYQYDGLDDLFIQARNADSGEPNYSILGALRQEWAFGGIFNPLVTNESRSRHIGPAVNVEAPATVHHNGSRRYVWRTADHEFLIDLYACLTLKDTHHTYAVSRGYERDSLFFVFVFDAASSTLELKAFIAEDLVPLYQNRLSYFRERRRIYRENVMQKHGFDHAENPVCGRSRVDKLRLCLLVLNTPHYKDRYEFAGDAASVDFQCRAAFIYRRKTGERIEELTYRCLVKTVSEPKTDAAVHIARNYADHKVTTFTTIVDESGVELVKFESGFKHVRFVEEPYNKRWQMIPRGKRTSSDLRTLFASAATDAGTSSLMMNDAGESSEGIEASSTSV